MKKAIIVGATSGIGRELAKILAKENYILGLVGRRENLLYQLKDELKVETHIKILDISETENSIKKVNDLIDEMGNVDLFIMSAGTGFLNKELNWDYERQTINTNVLGFTAVTNVAIKHFYKQGHGHFVGISSLAAIRGSFAAPAYNASKSYMSNYLEGLRQKVTKDKKSIYITDIQPGFVDTKMAKGEGLFWVASKEKAARQIYNAIKKKKDLVYITKRWRIIAWILKIVPNCLYKRF